MTPKGRWREALRGVRRCRFSTEHDFFSAPSGGEDGGGGGAALPAAAALPASAALPPPLPPPAEGTEGREWAPGTAQCAASPVSQMDRPPPVVVSPELAVEVYQAHDGEQLFRF